MYWIVFALYTVIETITDLTLAWWVTCKHTDVLLYLALLQTGYPSHWHEGYLCWLIIQSLTFSFSSTYLSVSQMLWWTYLTHLITGSVAEHWMEMKKLVAPTTTHKPMFSYDHFLVFFTFNSAVYVVTCSLKELFIICHSLYCGSVQNNIYQILSMHCLLVVCFTNFSCIIFPCIFSCNYKIIFARSHIDFYPSGHS